MKKAGSKAGWDNEESREPIVSALSRRRNTRKSSPSVLKLPRSGFETKLGSVRPQGNSCPLPDDRMKMGDGL
jgi:hypothetical protein